MKREVIITCEHASCDIPPAYKPLFRGQRQVLRSHRGYDPNSIELAVALSTRLNCQLFQGTVSRLLVELNRSLGHRALFSEFTRVLSESEQLELLNTYYFPYRAAVEHEVRSRIRKRRTVLHLSIHTFAPILADKPRIADVGLLFDPARLAEALLMRTWQREISKRVPELRTRRNYPYHGRSDGLTTYLRSKFADPGYLGIEIEVRNSLQTTSATWKKLMEEFAALAQCHLHGTAKW
ncbi:MAG TPA: N-formylglutamate amidohydrolase [Pirellulaceae bacterium]|nr:N-formylglutamate amidohydrolase [Pirellulaceae bacterium]